MSLKHKVSVNVTTPAGRKQTVLKSGIRTLPRRLLTALLGEGTQILILQPGQTVQSVEIHEVKEGGNAYEPHQVTT